MAIERTNLTATSGETELRPSTPPKEEWNTHCFQIVHTHHENNESTPKTTTRIFTAPTEDRNEWTFAMNNAIMGYEKRLSKARADAAKKELQQAAATKQQTKKARHGTLVLKSNEGEQLPPTQYQTTPWTNGIYGGRSGIRMRSFSPVCGAAAVSPMGLPPAGPSRRMRSPSPIRSRSITPIQT